MASKEKNTELRMLERIRKTFSRRVPGLLVGVGDDAAAVRCSDKKALLYTADMLVESVHFKKGEDFRKVGHKAIAVSVSDIVAMGGVPRYALVCVGLPKKNAPRIIDGLIAGIKECAGKYGVAVIGGDMVRSPCVVIDVFMTGEVDPGHMFLRSGARDGDCVFVTGTLGGSGRGRHLTFEPRLEASRFLSKRVKVTSMIDLSDGLAMDLNRIAAASGVGAMIFENKIPRSPGVKTIKPALHEGEDFELLFTVSSGDAFKLQEAIRKNETPCRVTSIGKMTSLVKGVHMVGLNGHMAVVPQKGFEHFAAESGTPAGPIRPGAKQGQVIDK